MSLNARGILLSLALASLGVYTVRSYYRRTQVDKAAIAEKYRLQVIHAEMRVAIQGEQYWTLGRIPFCFDSPTRNCD